MNDETGLSTKTEVCGKGGNGHAEGLRWAKKETW
jgi:hypothetical protein